VLDGQAAAHEHGHRPQNDGFAGLGAPFVVTDQAPAAQEPGEGSFDDPAAGQDLKALDVVAAADDVEDDSEVLGGPVGEVAGVTAVGPDPRQPPEVFLCSGSRMRAASRSVVEAGVTSTASRRPRVSVSKCRLRPLILFPASNPRE
jgi:hypothetical protein